MASETLAAIAMVSLTIIVFALLWAGWKRVVGGSLSTWIAGAGAAFLCGGIGAGVRGVLVGFPLPGTGSISARWVIGLVLFGALTVVGGMMVSISER